MANERRETHAGDAYERSELVEEQWEDSSSEKVISVTVAQNLLQDPTSMMLDNTTSRYLQMVNHKWGRIADVSEGQDIMECESLSMGFKDTISRVNGSSMIDSDVIQASTKLLEAFLTSVKNSHDLNTCF
ncbi:hypothetical protein V6N12_060940 [Hibiscus sabdariffa]|uniref:Uncharacterized protein n=1 Tax=Hibiscus sabdariffa TaxID=183260 RepID=A0ABR2DVK2_9ROSI